MYTDIYMYACISSIYFCVYSCIAVQRYVFVFCLSVQLVFVLHIPRKRT